MCGISGIVGKIHRPSAETAVRKMTCALARRGPDGEGIESWDEAVLGHRRLAVFDLSQAGRQPMLSKDRSVGIVFNGAIYNYRELRAELLGRGCAFTSKTDTEVLIHGYREWGLDELISKLRGMFAFGLWDDSKKKLYLVRDRLGVKPLIFSVRRGSIAFASTAGALRAAGYVDEIDENAVIDFLKYGFVTDDRSIYRGAVKVHAGSLIEWDARELKTRQYWTPPVAKTLRTFSFKQAVAETERLLLDAVAARLHADVPVGVLLSGGIDSGLVCWAVKELGSDITAYTVAVPGDPWDEAKSAHETAQILGIRHQILEMSEHDTLDIENIVSAYSEPFACASALGMLKVSQVVASSAKVLLTGDGGDDVFLGYPSHRNLWLAGKFSKVLPASLKSVWLGCRAAFPRTGPLRRAAALFDYVSGDLRAFFANGHGLLESANGLLGDRLRGSLRNNANALEARGANGAAIEEVLTYERKTRFVGEYMTKVDGATMHYALEARSPFLDQCLWEFASSLPFDVRLRGGRPKAILRELSRQKIAASVANRRKTGFGIPVQRWIVGRCRPQMEAAFHDSILDKEGWVHSGSVLAQLDSAARDGWAPETLWYLYVLESWMKRQMSNRAAENKNSENLLGDIEPCGPSN
ncbi:MAG: asparagine synthase (glutamine-hydrolyzing) [Alphaproteobacteria bacterium]